MAYVQYNKVICLESGIGKICAELYFDAHHEAFYEIGKYMSMEVCIELGDRSLRGDNTKIVKLVNFFLQLKVYILQSSQDDIAGDKSGVEDLGDDGEGETENKKHIS